MSTAAASLMGHSTQGDIAVYSIGSSRRPSSNRSALIPSALLTAQRLAFGIKTASYGLMGPGQHCNVRKHNFRSFHLETHPFQGALDVFWRQAYGLRFVQHASEEIPGGEGRLLARVVDHEIVNKHQAAWRKCIKRAAGKDSDIVSPDRAPYIGHENNIVPLWQIRFNAFPARCATRSVNPDR